jgi:hypothetical protein
MGFASETDLLFLILVFVIVLVFTLVVFVLIVLDSAIQTDGICVRATIKIVDIVVNG